MRLQALRKALQILRAGRLLAQTELQRTVTDAAAMCWMLNHLKIKLKPNECKFIFLNPSKKLMPWTVDTHIGAVALQYLAQPRVQAIKVRGIVDLLQRPEARFGSWLRTSCDWNGCAAIELIDDHRSSRIEQGVHIEGAGNNVRQSGARLSARRVAL